MIRLITIAAGLAAAAMLGVLLLFCGYGLIKGYDVISGVIHLFEADREPTDQNTELLEPAWSTVSWQGDIDNRRLNEASGLAASNRYDDVLWSINDSGSDAVIYAMTTSGRSLGEWLVDIEEPVDWEAIDAFVWQGRAYLLIADVGDNFRWRPTLSLHVIAEPTLAESTTPLSVLWETHYRYPDGYRDCEAVAVDTHRSRVLLLSKRHYPAELFSVPLVSGEAVEEAQFLGELSHLPLPTEGDYYHEEDRAHYLHMPSGMDIAGDSLLITTYKHAYLYGLDLNIAPLRLPLPRLGQREAIAFARAQKSEAFLTKERGGGIGVADLFKVEWHAP